jgi:hypothetical protein
MIQARFPTSLVYRIHIDRDDYIRTHLLRKRDRQLSPDHRQSPAFLTG